MSGGEFPKRDLTYLDLGEIVLADDLEVTVAIMNHGTASLPVGEVDALGAMMAAAPDMYEALMQCRALFEDDENIRQAIDAALSRASGKEA